MSYIRVNAEHLNDFLTLASNWATHNQGDRFKKRLYEKIGFIIDEFSHDFVTKTMVYLEAEDAPNPERSDHRGAWDSKVGDELPDSMKEPAQEQSHGPVPESAFGLAPLNVADPVSIWKYTRKNLLITEHIATFILNSGWDCIDHRTINSPLTKPAEEVRSILIEQQIEERYIKDCDPKFVGLMELIFKAFHHWWLENQKKNWA